MAGQQDPGTLANMRISYAGAGLAEDELAADWLTQFRRWFDQAVAAGVTEANAMVLATASENGLPASRTVLAKDVDEAGVTFYTNYTSAKSADLLRNPVASLTFPWIDLHRQVHVRGAVVQVDRETTQAYWATRPRGSQLGRVGQPAVDGAGQSSRRDPHRPDSFRRRITDAEAALEERFGGGPDAVDAPPVPVPPHWGGWLVVPDVRGVLAGPARPDARPAPLPA